MQINGLYNLIFVDCFAMITIENGNYLIKSSVWDITKMNPYNYGILEFSFTLILVLYSKIMFCIYVNVT